MSDSFLKRLFSKVDCGICGRKYDVSNIKIIDQENGLWVLSVYCSFCGTQGLIAAVIHDGCIEEIDTDFTDGECDLLVDGEAVGIDEVLDIHNFLRDFEGDFAALFSKN